MDTETFDELLSKVGPFITYQDTCMQKAIPPAEGLALTLHFLATSECVINHFNLSLIIYYSFKPFINEGESYK